MARLVLKVDKELENARTMLTAEHYERAVDIAVEQGDYISARELVMVMASNGVSATAFASAGGVLMHWV